MRQLVRSTDVIHVFTESGVSVIGALKSNRVLYPAGYKMQAGELATYMKEAISCLSV